MAHDALREDYLRMSLRYALSLDERSPDEAAHAFSSFGRRFAQNRDSLPQLDSDRAFHLVSLATEILDYRVPFASEDLVETLTERARGMLDEAVSLDSSCHDAIRMHATLDMSSYEECLRFLLDGAAQVRADCEARRDSLCDLLEEPRRPLAASLSMRPWWRWLAETAECALICGHNRQSVEAAEELLAADPLDISDVRFTLAYALAKLEDGPALERLARRSGTLGVARRADDAWMMLSRVALAHKRLKLDEARALLERLLATYRGCARVLVGQLEIADGSFARIRVLPYSEDELVVAVSEGTVLLQEGLDLAGRGVLGAWVARTVARMEPSPLAEEGPMAPHGKDGRA